MTVSPAWIDAALSTARFAPYLAKTSGDPVSAEELYWWNTEASSAFYGPLHCLEVSLRNAVHRNLATKWARTDWWEAAPLNRNGKSKVAQARAKLADLRRPHIDDDVVAQLSFGFWAMLLTTEYDRRLWVPSLHRAFPHFRGPRRTLHREVETMRLFRNRIMHHEPIHHRHLEADHQTIVRVIGYSSPMMAARLASRDRVPAVLARRPKVSSGR